VLEAGSSSRGSNNQIEGTAGLKYDPRVQLQTPAKQSAPPPMAVIGYDARPEAKTPDASMSIPDLRSSSKPFAKIALAIGALLVVGAVIGGVMIFKTGNNPGKAACDHIEEMAQKEPKRWDRFVGALERTVEERVWNSHDRKFVNITGDTRAERCEASFSVIRDTISYTAYSKLSDCVSKATSFRTGSDCFDTF
jgi:hypothetical protein